MGNRVSGKGTWLKLAGMAAALALPVGVSLGASFAPVELRVPEPGGPPPVGGPVETSVPFAPGTLAPEQIGALAVAGPDGTVVPTQTRVVWQWPDGSARAVRPSSRGRPAR